MSDSLYLIADIWLMSWSRPVGVTALIVLRPSSVFLLGVVFNGYKGEWDVIVSEMAAAGWIVSIILSFYTRAAKLGLSSSYIRDVPVGVIVSRALVLTVLWPSSSHTLVAMLNFIVSLLSLVTSRRPPKRKILSPWILKLCPHRGPGTLPICLTLSHVPLSKSYRHISLSVSFDAVSPPNRNRQFLYLDKTILQEVRWQGTCLANRTLLLMLGLSICALLLLISILNSIFDFIPFW